MARPRPPDYAIDSPAVYIPPDDEAWDLERVDREIDEEMYPAGHHPVQDYLTGRTRFKLDAVEEYLDRGKNPEEWTLTRELPTDQYYRVQALVRANSEDNPTWSDAMVLACKHGVVDVSPESVRREIGFSRTRGVLTEKCMLGIRRIGRDLVESLGYAVYAAGQPLTEPESKPSGS
jgi:hypothetical protein